MVLDRETGERTNLTAHEGDEANAPLTFSPDGTRIVSGGIDMTVRVWDVATGKETGTFKGHKWAISSVAFSPDGMRLASASVDGTIRVREGTIELPIQLYYRQGHAAYVKNVALLGIKIPV